MEGKRDGMKRKSPPNVTPSTSSSSGNASRPNPPKIRKNEFDKFNEKLPASEKEANDRWNRSQKPVKTASRRHRSNRRSRSSSSSGYSDMSTSEDEEEETQLDLSLRLDDCGGLDYQKRCLKNIIFEHVNRNARERMWGNDRIPKGILFHGCPGVGKTMLAKAFASELQVALNEKARRERVAAPDVQFIHRKGGDVCDPLIGKSEKNVADLFAKASRGTPCVLFLDELDGLCPVRNNDLSHCYVSVVNMFLGHLDNVKRGDVLVIGATNCLQAIDPAIRRAGRFDSMIPFFPPSAPGRKEILQIHQRSWDPERQSGEELLDYIVSRTIGFTGSDLAALGYDAIDAAIDRHMMGIEVDDADSFEIELDNLEVLEEDWSKALSGRQNTSSNTFGFKLFQREPIPPAHLALIESDVERISEDIVNLKNQSGVNFYVISSDDPNSSFVETTLIPAVLNVDAVDSMPVFELAYYRQFGDPEHYTNVLHEVMSCTLPCILLIPKVEKLLTMYPEVGKVILSLAMEDNKRIIVLVNTALHLDNLQSLHPELEVLEDSATEYEFNPPSQNELQAFFTDAFEETHLALRPDFQREVNAFARSFKENDTHLNSILNIRDRLARFARRKGHSLKFADVPREFAQIQRLYDI